MNQPSTRHYLLLVLVAAIWGSSFQAMKVSVAEIPPLSIAAGRVVVATAAVWLFTSVAQTRFKASFSTGSMRLWVAVLPIAVFNMVLPFFLLPWGEQFVGSGTAAILMGIGPIFALVLAHFFTQGDRLTRGKIIGMALGLAGVAVLVKPQAGLGQGALQGQAAILLAAVCYSVGGVLTARAARVYSAETLTLAVLFASAAILLPLAVLIDRPWEYRPGLAASGAVLYLGLFPTAIALLVRFRLIAKVGYTFVAQSVYMIPAFGALWGWVLLNEAVDPATWLALGLVLLGVGVARRPRKKRRLA